MVGIAFICSYLCVRVRDYKIDSDFQDEKIAN